ncbi:MAG: hypothetical protein HC860_10000 [Alkalinema sp. RU_4_3]|nr:hypothetical protein [Alkalinema sp. RU_4_3]
MLQSFQSSAFLQSLKMRYVILFAIGLLLAFVLPLIALSMGNAEASYSMPLQQMNQSIDPTNMSVSLTHQEPNFYQ